MEKTKSERLQIINEVKLNVLSNNLENELASKILFQMLENYYENGTIYENKELNIVNLKKKYIINLYNNKRKSDVVLIRKI